MRQHEGRALLTWGIGADVVTTIEFHFMDGCPSAPPIDDPWMVPVGTHHLVWVVSPLGCHSGQRLQVLPLLLLLLRKAGLEGERELQPECTGWGRSHVILETACVFMPGSQSTAQLTFRPHPPMCDDGLPLGRHELPESLAPLCGYVDV